MIPFSQLTRDQARQIRYVLCDIDDTITTCGKLSSTAYSALWRLQDGGIQVIPVTGRPAGWCDMILRQWPVRAVVGENGAFTYYLHDGHLCTFTHPSVASGDIQRRLSVLREACLREVPGCRVARDQFARIYDLAIDFNEDPPYLGLEAAKRIQEVCQGLGATAKISSIHVNAWFGEYNKLDMTRRFFTQVLGEKEEIMKSDVLFFGDSPNDEPMFSFFPLSAAVANIQPFAAQLQHLPTYVTRECSGEGFSGAVEQLMILRKDGAL